MVKTKNALVIERLAKENTLKVGNATYNHSKLAEELAELGEVLIKMVNKIPEKQPPVEKLVEEMGDVFIRMNILMDQEGITKEIGKRIDSKLAMLDKYANEGKYKGGV